MAECKRFICANCGKEIDAWDDGNPYYLDEHGKKQYAYHPDERRDRCIGNDSPRLCLACGEMFVVDSRAPTAHCPTCDSTNITSTFQLGGCGCPFCKAGVFGADPEFFAVS